MKLTNLRNRIIYHLWSPIYDGLFDGFFASPGRRRAMQVLDLRPGERVLLVGVGTGADLPLLPTGIWAAGLDLSPDMLARAPLSHAAMLLKTGDRVRVDGGRGIVEILSGPFWPGWKSHEENTSKHYG